MAFQLNDFRNKLVAGGARPSQFEMQLTWPDAIRGVTNVTQAESDFRFFCQISEIPPSQVGQVTVPYFGRKLNYVGDRVFPNLNVTIINDEDFKVRKALEVWSQACTDHASTVSVFAGGNAAGSYATDGVVTQYSRNNGGSAIQAYKFIGMFPINIAAIPLDWNAVDSFESFTCEFVYQWWEPIDANSGVSVTLNL
jgi:hypothetical protein